MMVLFSILVIFSVLLAFTLWYNGYKSINTNNSNVSNDISEDEQWGEYAEIKDEI
jgi:multidrug resistance efflux pump